MSSKKQTWTKTPGGSYAPRVGASGARTALFHVSLSVQPAGAAGWELPVSTGLSVHACFS